MKNIFLKIVIVILTVGVITSCSDEFLDQSNPNEVDVTNYWRNLEETQAGLHATYKMLYNPSTFNIIEEMLRSDLGYPSLDRPLPASPNTFYIHTYTSTTDEVNDKWQTNYTGIFRANQVIEALESLESEGEITEEDVADWTSQMAQARFFRGLFHYNLYTTYNKGAIIIRDKVPTSLDEYSMPLSNAEDVLKFIREDLEFAYQNLYKNGEYPDGDISKVTAGAAGALLGDSYLNELDYTSAMTYYNDVVNNHGYQLETDLEKMFTTAGEFNSESIFEINFTADNVDLSYGPWDGETGTNTYALYTRGNTQKTASSPVWVAYAYKTEEKDPLDQRNYYIDPLDNTKKIRNVSLRASSMLAVVEDVQTTYYQVPTHLVTAPPFNGVKWGGFGWWKKYSNHDIVALESDIPNGAAYSAKNVTLLRLSGVLLNLAECKIKTGDVDGALTLINSIRKRWGLVLLGKPNGDTAYTYDKEDTDAEYTADELMQRFMRVEKPLEMGAEGHAARWLDFQRWKKSDNYGFGDRLKELEALTLYGVNYDYIDENGAIKTKGNAPSVSEDSSNAVVTVDYEYDLSASNYSEDKHGYYPIPSREVESNNKID
ncbi:Starch-binding associating with outer membrane [Polaribacter sp. KT25b]|uniref:RagB/SusD family nutrient uptake outer membrane protein n=1 Tax=Polaribacter sp. KT25b TaxID=1855336 RepID=UPI00087A062E|nr:RagB/SusD family nutrient uptake outer membrane protein [Polaribacter sp. KT25b]SDR70695.1 Starch-binding associating with outer membrane [Polaribacter sp. KT25b]